MKTYSHSHIQGLTQCLGTSQEKKANNLFFFIFISLYYEENSISITKTKKFISTEKKNHISLKESQVQHHHKIPRDHQIHQRCIYTYSEVSLSVEGKGLSPWQPYWNPPPTLLCSGWFTPVEYADEQSRLYHGVFWIYCHFEAVCPWARYCSVSSFVK